MEILVGLLSALFVYLYIYIDAIKKQKVIIELKKMLSTMDQDLKTLIINSMTNFEKRITKLEIEVAKIKVKAGIYAAIFSGFVMGTLRVIEYLIFKT
jgi:hypothetical protein